MNNPVTFKFDATVAGKLSINRFEMNGELVNFSEAQVANAWHELLAGGGIKGAIISGRGLLNDAKSDDAFIGGFFSGTIRNWQFVVPDLGTIEGRFQIMELQYLASNWFEFTLESRSAICLSHPTKWRETGS